MELRPCQNEDLSTLISISRKTYTQHYAHLWEDGGTSYMEQQFKEPDLLQQIADPNCGLFLVVRKQKPIGVVKLNYNIGIAPFESADCIEIQRMYLLENCVGKGIGTRIFDKIEKIARQKNESVLWLMVMDTSPARSFYEKCGYVVQSRSSYNFPGIRPQLKGMYVMVKKLI